MLTPLLSQLFRWLPGMSTFHGSSSLVSFVQEVINNAEEEEDAGEDSEREESNDGFVIPLTDDLSTSIELKEEFLGETAGSGTDSGHACQDGAAGNITRFCFCVYIVDV